MANGCTHPAPGSPASGSNGNLDKQITRWWQEVEKAVCGSQPERARRFLRWIITCHPDEEEAWLALAHLSESSEERLRTLRQAYTFHPHSLRVVSRLSHARAEFLESTVGDVVRPHRLIRCLPDERCLPHSNGSRSHNGNGAHPPGQNGHARNLLSRLLHALAGMP